MKKICIVTWCYSPNYGTCLQAYALQHKLQKVGYDVCLAYGVNSNFSFKHYLIVILSCFGITQIKDYLEAYITRQMYAYLKNRQTQKWVRSHLRIVPQNFRFQLKKCVEMTDCFIAGSDQIWNTYNCFDPAYFLDFVSGKKRMSYASSIGTATIKPDCINEVRTLLMRFSHISVRESESVGVLSPLLNRNDICQVLDPTLLISREEWATTVSGVKVANFDYDTPYLFCYLLGSSHDYASQVANVKRQAELTRVVLVRSAENPDLQIPGAEIIDCISPFDFVVLLLHAAFVCTDSFHATAFSVNFNKPFVEFLRFRSDDAKSQNGRIVGFLERYGLQMRIYEPEKKCLTADIDYEVVNRQLQIDREQSLRWLINSIEN